jgi:thiosulfate dehydrogenase
MRWIHVLCLGLALVVSACLDAAAAGSAALETADQYGDLVRFGKNIFTNTPAYAGRYVGNRLSCANCHLDAGTRANTAPMWAAFSSYPAYQAKVDRVVTLEDRIAQCFRFSENGFAPTRDSHAMIALLAYMRSISGGRTIGAEEGRGFPTLTRPAQGASPRNGQQVYQQRCAACHGADGRGNAPIPPLWGMESFSRGAGFNNNDILAGFVHANMPPGGPGLTVQEAWDVSAWINRQLRPPDPRKGLLGMFQ